MCRESEFRVPQEPEVSGRRDRFRRRSPIVFWRRAKRIRKPKNPTARKPGRAERGGQERNVDNISAESRCSRRGRGRPWGKRESWSAGRKWGRSRRARWRRRGEDEVVEGDATRFQKRAEVERSSKKPVRWGVGRDGEDIGPPSGWRR